MKRFDEAAAKRGATVCTRGGGDAIIIRFDLDRVDNKNILAVFCMRGRFDEQKTRIGVFPSNGQFCDDMEGLNDLMMADDDYLEKLERGEYGVPAHASSVWQEAHIMTPEQIGAQMFASTADEAYWRKTYAGMVMQGLMADNAYKKLFAGYAGSGIKEMADASMVSIVIADALIEELKKEKQ